MATKKKAKKGTKSKRSSGKKLKKSTRAAKKEAPKKPARKKARKKNGAASARKPLQTAKSSRQNAARKNSTEQSAPFETRVPRTRSETQAGDLQGLSDIEGADSESVSELLDEGNAFEAGVVAGVEHVDDNEEREVHTHEVPEDDVPEEYLDED